MAMDILVGSFDQQWWMAHEFPTTIGLGGSEEPVLPYGWAIRAGAFICISRTTGVTCANEKTGAEFTTNQSKTTFGGPTYRSAREWSGASG